MVDARDLDARIAALDPARRALLERRRRGLRAQRLGPGIPRRPPATPAPLSFAQERLWFLDRLVPGRADYNVATSLRLSGELDEGALAAALDAVVRRHELLRSAVEVTAGVPRQVPGGASPGLERADLTTMPEAARDAEAHRRAVAEARRGFDLTSGPLLRSVLLRLAPAEHQLSVTAHHLVFDGWSIDVLAADLATAYAALRDGGAPGLGDLEVQYGDYAAWQRSPAEAARLDALVDRWREAFGPAPAPLTFGSGQPVAPGAVLAGGRVPLAVPAGLGQAVDRLATAEGTTPAVVLLAAWAATLARATGRDDFLLGVPLAGRTRPELEPLVGLFANTVPVRVDCSGAPAFRELVRRTTSANLRAWDLQDLPFECLVRALNPPRAAGSTPLLSAAFVPQVPAPAVDLAGLTCSPVPVTTGLAVLELTLAVRHEGGRLGGHVEHALDAVGRDEAAGLAGAYVELLAAVTADPDRPVHPRAGAPAPAPAPAGPPPAPAGPEAGALLRTQTLMWLGQRLHPSVPLYNQVVLVSLAGDVDAGRFAAAFARVAATTDALRLRVASEGGVPRQSVAGAPTFALETVDLRDSPGGAAALEAWVAGRSGRMLDLGAAAGDTALLRLGSDRWAWYLCLHHLATDARSSWLLVRRVLAAYESASAADGWQDAPGIAALVRDEQAWLASPRGRAAGEHWERVLARPSPRARFYGVAPPEGATLVVRRTIPLGRATVARLRTAHDAAGLRAFSGEQAVFTVLAAATAAWLRRVSGNDRVSLGVPFHNRATRAARQAVGPLLSICPLVVEAGPADTFGGLTRKVGEAVRAALPHARAGIPNRPGRRAYDVVVNLHAFDASELPGGLVRAVELRNAGHEFDPVTVHATSTDGLATLELAVDLAVEAFPGDRADLATAHLRQVLGALVEDPSCPVDALDLEAPGEAQAPAGGAQAPAGEALPPERAGGRAEPLVRLVAARARETPDAVAVEGAGGHLTYAGLLRRAGAVAGHLRAAGVCPEQPVAVLAGRTPEAVVALLAVLAAGGAYVPLDPGWPDARVATVLDEAGADVLLASSALVDRARRQARPRHALDLGAMAAAPRPAASGPGAAKPGPGASGRGAARLAEPEPAGLAAILFTSGSSGRPKGVLVEHGALASYVRAAADEFALTAADRVLAFASPAFDTALEEVLATLVRGATLVLRDGDEPDTPAAFLRRCEAGQLTVVDLPTGYWHVLVREAGPRLGELARSVRLAVVGGEALARDAVERWEAALGGRVHLLNTYGPTEGTIVATAGAPATARWPAGGGAPIGRPVGGAGVRVLTGLGAAVPPGVTGELAICGSGVARGYLGQPRLTAERFVPDPAPARPGARAYRTGDLGHRDGQGEFVFDGRADRQVKVAGQRVEPGEVEAVLATHEGVLQAAVLAESAPEGTRLAAVVAAAPGASVSAGQLDGFARARLPAALVPGSWQVVDRLPLTASGKVDRVALRGAGRRAGDAAPETAPRDPGPRERPRTADEAAVAAEWAALLDVPAEATGVDDDFFVAGGHSLLATVLVARVEEALGVEVGLRPFFESPTVAGLARAVGRARDARAAGAGRPPLRPLDRRPGHPLPVSPTQRQLWYLDRLDPGTPRWNLPAAVRVRGPLDVAALRRALLAVVERHETLRTTFADDAGRPVAVVGPVPPLALEVTDLGGLGPDDREARLRHLAQADAGRGFDLAAGPLLRAAAVRMGPDEHVVLLCLHHIVADGWSVGVLVRDLVACYEADLAGTVPALPVLDVQYADVAAWQERWLGSDGFAASLRWWVASLDGAPPVLDLPADRPRPAVATHRGVTRTRTLDAAVVGGVRALARQAGATPFAVLLAAYATLLSRLSGAADLVVGTPAAGRVHPATEPLVGAFMNSLPLRVDASGNPPFADLVRRVARHATEALVHQQVPLDAIVRAVNPPRAAAHDPLFQVMFTFLNEPTRAAVTVPGLDVELLDIDRGSANRDLTLRIEDAPPAEPAYRCHVEASADLFEPETVEAIAERYASLLAAAVDRPGTRLESLPLAPLRAGDGTATPPRAGDGTTGGPGGQPAARPAARSRFEQALARGPRRLDLGGPDLVEFRPPGDGEDVPVLAVPRARGVDLAAWLAAHREEFDRRLLAHGAVLFRGFEVAGAAAFEQVSRAGSGGLAVYDEASTPRSQVSGRVYTSTEYPPEEAIMLHNEMAYAHHWPRHLWFCCRWPASSGGATPLADSRRVLRLLDPGLVERLRRVGVGYLRNFGPRLDLPWQQAFGSDDRATVEARCREWGIACEWLGADRLRTRAVRQATTRHPVTGEEVWFNAAHMFHVAALPAETARSLRSLVDGDDLPRHAFAGDGSPIADGEIDHIRDVYTRAAVRFEWRAGDVLAVDNLLLAHGRDPFAGEREVLVAMAGVTPGDGGGAGAPGS